MRTSSFSNTSFTSIKNVCVKSEITNNKNYVGDVVVDTFGISLDNVGTPDRNNYEILCNDFCRHVKPQENIYEDVDFYDVLAQARRKKRVYTKNPDKQPTVLLVDLFHYPSGKKELYLNSVRVKNQESMAQYVRMLKQLLDCIIVKAPESFTVPVGKDKKQMSEALFGGCVKVQREFSQIFNQLFDSSLCKGYAKMFKKNIERMFDFI
jgi:hypothetical protein